MPSGPLYQPSLLGVWRSASQMGGVTEVMEVKEESSSGEKKELLKTSAH